MIALVFDLKIGFENMYVVERGVEFPLDFLQDPDYRQLNSMSNLLPATDIEIFQQYGLNPGQLVRDFKILPVIRALIAKDFRPAFSAIGKITADSVYFPELFSIFNLSLRQISLKDDQVEDDSDEGFENYGSGGYMA